MTCTTIAVADSQITYASQAANRFLASPSGASGAPTYRAIASVDLPTSGVSANTYNSVTVDTYGRVTAGTNPTTLSGYGITDAVKSGGQAGALTLGTSDATNLTLNTNNTAKMTILSNGNVGISSTIPTAKLDVGGQTRSTNSAGATQANASAAVNWNNGNVQTMSVDCATTAFTNMLDSGTYVLAVSETGTSTCVFSQAGLTFFYSPANAARTSGQRTVYTFQRIGNDVYVSWVRGFQ